MKRDILIAQRVRIFADTEAGIRRALASLRSEDGIEFSGFSHRPHFFEWEKIGRPRVASTPASATKEKK